MVLFFYKACDGILMKHLILLHELLKKDSSPKSVSQSVNPGSQEERFHSPALLEAVAEDIT